MLYHGGYDGKGLEDNRTAGRGGDPNGIRQRGIYRRTNWTKCEELANQIDQDYAGEEILLVGLLKGSVPFLAELGNT